MAQLSTIISSILRDMIHAQHQANVYSMMLEDMYRQNGALEKFSLPTTNLSDVELDLRYGVTDASPEAEQYEINFPLVKKMAKKLSVSCANLLIRSSVVIFKEVFESHELSVENYFENLDRNINLRDKYSTFLSRAINKELRKATTSIINNGKPDINTLVGILREVAENHILRNEDVAELFRKINDIRVLKDIRKELYAAIENGIPALVKDIDFKRKRILPSMDVVVNAEELSQLPDEAIHTLHIKLTPKNINLLLKDE